MFTQTKEFKKLQQQIAKKNAAHVMLRNTFEQGEAQTYRSLNEVKASLMAMVEVFDSRKPRSSILISTSDISTAV